MEKQGIVVSIVSQCAEGAASCYSGRAAWIGKYLGAQLRERFIMMTALSADYFIGAHAPGRHAPTWTHVECLLDAGPQDWEQTMEGIIE